MDINSEQLYEFIKNYELEEPLASMAFDHWDDKMAGEFLRAAFQKVREDFDQRLAAELKARRGD